MHLHLRPWLMRQASVATANWYNFYPSETSSGIKVAKQVKPRKIITAVQIEQALQILKKK